MCTEAHFMTLGYRHRGLVMWIALKGVCLLVGKISITKALSYDVLPDVCDPITFWWFRKILLTFFLQSSKPLTLLKKNLLKKQKVLAAEFPGNFCNFKSQIISVKKKKKQTKTVIYVKNRKVLAAEFPGKLCNLTLQIIYVKIQKMWPFIVMIVATIGLDYGNEDVSCSNVPSYIWQGTRASKADVNTNLKTLD